MHLMDQDCSFGRDSWKLGQRKPGRGVHGGPFTQSRKHFKTMPWAVGAGPSQTGSVSHVPLALRHRLPKAWPQTAGTCYPRLTWLDSLCVCSAALLRVGNTGTRRGNPGGLVLRGPTRSCSPPSSV